MMACTTSVGPGATNMVTAAAVAHLNRLPVLLLPGDAFASRLPDPVLQQVEDFSDPTVTANDCFKPVSRYWDRITRPEQLMQSLPQAISVLTDTRGLRPGDARLAAGCTGAGLRLSRTLFSSSRCTGRVRQPPDSGQLQGAVERIARAQRPLIVAGGGVHYSAACSTLGEFAEQLRIPVAETQAGKGALPWTHPCNVGAIGVTGSAAANTLADNADLIIAIGTRLQDFTTGSRAPGSGARIAACSASTSLATISPSGRPYRCSQTPCAHWNCSADVWTTRTLRPIGSNRCEVFAVHGPVP